MDQTSYEFEMWPNRIISLRVTFPKLGISLKLADKVDMNEVLDEFENCLDQIIYFRFTPP